LFQYAGQAGGYSDHQYQVATGQTCYGYDAGAFAAVCTDTQYRQSPCAGCQDQCCTGTQVSKPINDGFLSEGMKKATRCRVAFDQGETLLLALTA